MKKALLLTLAGLMSFGAFSQAIIVNTNAHTPDDLVKNVLVQNSCLVQISNVQATTGANFGSANGIGHYQNTNASFPVSSSGVLLTTGHATMSAGPNTGTPLNGGDNSLLWVGDTGLEAALASAGVIMNSHNATILEFDFIPNTSNFSFDFLFASEEYGTQFQCTSNDAFAVLLTQGSTTQNVAVIPSTSIPITVSNIRNNLYWSGCASANPAFFGAFNGGAAAASAPINYNGQTVLMRATATVTPNVQYHIRFVIADDGGADGTDGDYDSAVFIPAGSLNLGQKVFESDLTVANGNALCYGQSYVLNTNLSDADYDFAWTKDTGPIPGGDGPSITVTQPGTYAVTITRPDIGCVTTQTIKIEYRPEIVPGTPQNIVMCDTGAPTYSYDLSQNTPLLKQGLDPAATVTYHATQGDATNNNNPPLPVPYNAAPGTTVWARVQVPNGCYAVRPFQLVTTPAPVANAPAPLTLCESAQGANSAIFDLTQQTLAILNGQSQAENQVLYFTSLPAAQIGSPSIATPESFTGTTQTIYARVQKSFDATCHAITQFQITVNPLPVLPAPATVNACNSYVLPVIAGANYYTGIGGTGTMYAGGSTITTSQMLYIYAQSGGTPNCSNQSQVTINIITAATAPANVTACVSYELPPLAIGEYRDAPAGGGNIIPAGTIITGTQTIYYFIPSAASCTQNNNFIVTITNTPVVTQPANAVSCGPYTLPALPSGERYFTGPNGTGTQLANGATVNSSQTIYVLATNPGNASCTAESSFTVTVYNVAIPSRADVTRCSVYVLPALATGNYYTGPGGTGTMLPVGAQITTTQTIYMYAQSPADPSCNDQKSFLVTINTIANIPVIPNVTACGSYTLPSNPVADYYTGPGGTGTMLPAGTIITSTQTIYAFNQTNTIPNCTRERSFTVTIIDLTAVNPGDQVACGNYILPPLSIGRYFTGPNGTGNQLNPGQSVGSSGRIYIYAVSNTTPPCTAEVSFEVTIVERPVIAPIPNVVNCVSYELPPLALGNYYTGPDGTGTMLPAGTIITVTQDIHVYAEAATTMTPPCSRNRTFRVRIIDSSLAPANVTACGGYTLLPLAVGQYRTAPNGGGTVIPVGTNITATQTIYVYAATATLPNCTDDDSFLVTINPIPLADDPADVRSCVNYTLPALANGNYYTGPNGTGTMLTAGQVITTNQTIYVYNSSTGLNCATQNSFNVEILDITVTDIPDVIECAATGYTLQPLAVGNYYTGPNGTGTMLNAGDIIITTQTIYIYAATTTPPVCSDQEDFLVTIKQPPVIDNPGIVGSCGNYTLPTLTNGDYYTGPGGTGTHLFAGQVISETTQLYIFAQTGGVPNCVSENVFNVIINPGPPANVEVCNSYVLPVLDLGDYFTGPAGTGTPKFAGDVITTTQQMYVYINLGTSPNCTDTNSFTITINQSPALAPVTSPISACDRYELPPLTVGDYYTQPAGQGTMLHAGDFIISSQTVYIYAATATTPPCTSEESFDVIIYPTPLADARSDVPVCGSYTLDQLLVGNYFTGPGGTGTALSAGNVITSTQTIYIYAENPANPACYTENSFMVEVFSIIADDPVDVTQCDSYALPALAVGKYYANPGGLSPTNPEIPVGTIITTPGVNTLYVHAETGGSRINCTDENSFTVTIYQTPVVDDSQGNVAACAPFVLPSLAAGTPGGYYTGPGGTGTPLAAGTSITTPTTVYVYAASDPAGLCFDEHSFFADINIIDVTAPADITICLQYVLPALASGNYYTAPNGGGTMLSAGDIITTTQTLYVYETAGTTVPCTDEDDFTVTIITEPQIFPPAPLVECGIDDHGHSVFNLIPAMQFALGSQANMDVQIYETPEDAAAGVLVNMIPNPGNYSNLDAYNQTLYIRVFSTVSDCYSVAPLQLIVNDRPIATEPQDLEVCDDNTDGSAIFNLTLRQSEILGTMSPLQFTVAYYDTLANAEAGLATGRINNPVTYTSATATVYVRVTNNTTGCYDVVPLNLVVNALPVANQPTPITLCDVNNPGDGREEFDLTSRIDQITGGAGGVTVTFYHTFAQAQAGNPATAIANPSEYVNGATVETLFARVTTDSGCFRIVLLDVRVEPLPQLTMPDPDDLTVCDADGDGFAVFNLQALVNGMLNNATNYQLTMHYTAEDAETGLNPITNLTNFVNDEPNDIIYVRAVNTTTGCVNYNYFFTLHVNLAPQMPDLDDIAVCDTDTNNNGQTIVNLTQQNADIIAAIGSGYTIQYFTSQASADLGAPRITNPGAYMGTNGQEIWVRATDADGCFGITSFLLNIAQPLVLTTPSPLSICDTQPNDSRAEFDLSEKENEILGPFGVGQGYILTYYTKNAGTPVNINPIANPGSFTQIANPESYTNPVGINPQTVYIIVTSPSPESCRSFTTLTIRVLPAPSPDMTPDALEVCDDDTDGQAVFNLRDAEADIRDNDTTVILTYYTTRAAAEAGVAGTEIATPQTHLSASGIVYVRVEANTNNPADPKCYEIVELELIVNPLPVLGDPATGVIPPYAYCDVNNTGFHQFTLNSHIPRILQGQNAADYTVRFYLTQAHATAGTPALPNLYTNTTADNQTIWVRVRNNATGCINIGSFQLLVEELAIANPVTDTTPYEGCDTADGDNDGIGTFDLTYAGAQALGTQNPAQFVLSYYETQADAEADTNAIPNPAAYRNTNNPELATIWIRVTNTATVSGCPAYTSFDIQWEMLPEPVISSDNGNALCFDFGSATPNNTLTLDSGITEPGHTFQWYLGGAALPGATGATYSPTVEGAYTVIATGPAPFNCQSNPSAVFTVIKSGPAEFVGAGYTVSNAFSELQTITITVQGYGEYEYRLDNGPWQTSNVFTNVTPGLHEAFVRDIKGDCGEISKEDISIIDYPRYFTPNGDGFHDTWNIIGLSGQPDAKIYIFDRYGKLIKQISAGGRGWDGTMNGNPLPGDDYWFTVTYRESLPDGSQITKEFKSHMSLKR